MKGKLIIFLVIYLIIGFIPVSAQIFTRVIHPVFTNKDNVSYGCGFFDYNNDGKLDLFLTLSQKGGSKLFRNDGNDNFTEIIDSSIESSTLYNIGITYGDYDNDGFNDLFMSQMAGNNTMLHNEGNGKFKKINNSMWSKDGGFQVHCSFADYDNDGFIDLFIPASDGGSFVKGVGNINYLYHNNGGGSFTKVGTSEPEKVKGNNVCANFCDFDNDGDMDLFMTDCQVNNHLFENVNGSFKEIDAGVSENTNTSLSCSWGDYDNDGFMDLFVTNGAPSSGGKYPNYLYHNNGNKTFTKVTTGPVAEYTGNSWTSLWADFDNDGDLDLFLGTTGSPDVLFLNNGDGTFTKTSEFDTTGNSTSGASFGDYNNDGFLDLYSGYRLGNNALLSGNTLYKNNGNNNHWLIIACEGTLSNRSAIGARVKIKATVFGKSYWQIREINGNMGLRSLNDLRAYFGLGDASVIDSLIIDWPSKQKTVLTGIQVNQALKIKETIPTNYLKPNFKTNICSGFSPLKVKFTDISVYDEVKPVGSWSWDLDGDGKEDSNEKNPEFSYYNYAGKSYNVSLTISNGNKTETVTRNNLITLLPLYEQNIANLNLATASSCFDDQENLTSKLVDGNTTSYWQSAASDTQWVQIQLDSMYAVGKIVINWGTYFAKHYIIQYSQDGNNWQEIKTVDKNSSTVDTVKFETLKAKFVKLLMTQRLSGINGYRINEIEIYRPEIVTDVELENKSVLATGFELYPNYPNPFNPSTVISYQLPVSSHVELKVFDVLGREIAALVNKEQEPGSYNVKFDACSNGGSNLASGIYLYRFHAGSFIQTHKMMFLK